MRLLTTLLLALVLTASAATAQRGEMLKIPVEQLGNFEIQDLMIQIRYAEDDGRMVPASITARAPDGKLDMRQLVLSAVSGDKVHPIVLRPGDDGMLVGTGELPPLAETQALHLRMSPRSERGFNIGMPPTLRADDIVGSAQGKGWTITVSMDWPLDVDIVIEG
jgi:hypothetical protein